MGMRRQRWRRGWRWRCSQQGRCRRHRLPTFALSPLTYLPTYSLNQVQTASVAHGLQSSPYHAASSIVSDLRAPLLPLLPYLNTVRPVRHLALSANLETPADNAHSSHLCVAASMSAAARRYQILMEPISRGPHVTLVLTNFGPHVTIAWQVVRASRRA